LPEGVFNTRKKGIERYAMVSEVLEPRMIPMDLIVKTPAEIRKRKNYFDPFIRNIEMNGKVFYEKKSDVLRFTPKRKQDRIK
jgi:hypothetical protein